MDILMKKRHKMAAMRAVAVAAGLAAAPALAASQPAPQGMAQYVSPAPSGMLERARRMMAAGNYGAPESSSVRSSSTAPP